MKLWSSSKPQSFPDTEPLSQPMHHAGDTFYDQTVPQPLEPLADIPAPKAKISHDDLGSLSLAPVEVTLYEALAEIRKDNRISPQPTRWREFYRLLGEQGDGSPLPPEPLTGSAWASTPSLAKRMCFREQVEWAGAHGCLAPAFEFLKSLPESDWNYMS
ncbi:hypothetical protein [Ramlibacter sp.]|uniref:hypothetical protein n=1 Tax=Ramlibacter sp. TaxID=1917967 RepID=UPI002FC92C46